jgi:hypothetical protein
MRTSLTVILSALGAAALLASPVAARRCDTTRLRRQRYMSSRPMRTPAPSAPIGRLRVGRTRRPCRLRTVRTTISRTALGNLRRIYSPGGARFARRTISAFPSVNARRASVGFLVSWISSERDNTLSPPKRRRECMDTSRTRSQSAKVSN